jgi:4-hydroxy-2-oxoheptanedioate aldolase
MGSDYAAGANDQVYLAVQIEQQVAAEQAEEILGVEGVDGCWIGPSDLGLSMGVDLSTEAGRQAHHRLIMGVVEVCYKLGKVPGIAGTPQTAAKWFEQGMRYVTVGGELTLLQPAATALLAELRKVTGK